MMLKTEERFMHTSGKLPRFQPNRPSPMARHRRSRAGHVPDGMRLSGPGR
jgi:hypothetical protein